MVERGMEHKGGGNMEHVESLKGSASDMASKEGIVSTKIERVCRKFKDGCITARINENVVCPQIVT